MTELTMDELKTAFRLVIKFFLKGKQVLLFRYIQSKLSPVKQGQITKISFENQRSWEFLSPFFFNPLTLNFHPLLSNSGPGPRSISNL